jgi:hypothetical protein
MAQQQMSLFGPSLAQAQAAMAQEDEAITAKLAQLTPEQGLVRIATQGGRQAGRALGGLFGIEDPRLKEAAQQEAIFKELKDSGVDFTKPEQLYPALINAYQSRGMIDKAIVASAKYEDVKQTQQRGRLTEAQIKSAEGTEKRAEAAATRTEEEYDYRKSQRALDEATKQLAFVAKVQDINSRGLAAEAAQVALDKAKAEMEAMPSGFYKRQYELKLEKLEADIKAAKALATYRDRERVPEKKRSAEIPIRDELGMVIGKTIVYNDGTRETVYGNAAPSTEDTASQAAKGIVPGSTNMMEQFKQMAIAEKKRREEERKRQQPGAK